VSADGHLHSDADLLTDTKSFPKQTCDVLPSASHVRLSSLRSSGQQERPQSATMLYTRLFVLCPPSLIPRSSFLVPCLNTLSPDPPR
jgi:hypothetical protein